jgi:hypothetical protein
MIVNCPQLFQLSCAQVDTSINMLVIMVFSNHCKLSPCNVFEVQISNWQIGTCM